jgi:hypothetical protein
MRRVRNYSKNTIHAVSRMGSVLVNTAATGAVVIVSTLAKTAAVLRLCCVNCGCVILVFNLTTFQQSSEEGGVI